MSWTLDIAASQTGRVALVTGANSGLGFDTARALAGLGAHVILACRSADKAAAAKATIAHDIPKAKLSVVSLDLASLASVKACAQSVLKKHKRLDLLINNAGLMMPPYALTADGFESQFGANHLGHFALTAQLMPLIDATPGARIVSLASLAHRWGPIRFDDPNFERGYNKRAAYAQSKLACLMFAFELNRRLRAAGSTTLSIAAHPGLAATNLAQHFPKALSLLFPLVGQSAAKGALPTLYAALGEDIEGGDYCGPRNLHQMRGEPIKVGSSRAARNAQAAASLWELSESMTGMRFAV
jgi:NAD(P)-dependent dehydrogenase (short-subunit alcohol dehydrogenase family)